jgi:hypothetical protein
VSWTPFENLPVMLVWVKGQHDAQPALDVMDGTRYSAGDRIDGEGFYGTVLYVGEATAFTHQPESGSQHRYYL